MLSDTLYILIYLRTGGFKMNIKGLPITVDIPNILDLSEEEYALARRNGLGASDASVFLGVQPFKTIPELIQEKCTLYWTEEEQAIGQKEAVRKGKDLEPLILQKASAELGVFLEKPTAMYRHKDYTFLTINFDGVFKDYIDGYIPVECKFVTVYGDKYYNRNDPEGIPEYYKAQLQQQMLCLNAPYGYLAALFDKGWIFHPFKIQRDEAMINRIVIEGYQTWEKILARRKG